MGGDMDKKVAERAGITFFMCLILPDVRDGMDGSVEFITY